MRSAAHDAILPDVTSSVAFVAALAHEALEGRNDERDQWSYVVSIEESEAGK